MIEMESICDPSCYQNMLNDTSKFNIEYKNVKCGLTKRARTKRIKLLVLFSVLLPLVVCSRNIIFRSDYYIIVTKCASNCELLKYIEISKHDESAEHNDFLFGLFYVFVSVVRFVLFIRPNFFNFRPTFISWSKLTFFKRKIWHLVSPR